MSGGFQRERTGTLELVHHYIGGDGAAALDALLEGFRERHGSITVRETQYDNMRLQVKSRILGQDPPDAWTGWPGGELDGYVDVNVAADITEVWEESDMVSNYRSVVADAAMQDGNYFAVPIAVHRINDLYLHSETVDAAGIDPETASNPTDLVEMLGQVADETEGPGILLPMADPFPVLQLWEVTLLGLFDHRTFEAITDGNAGRYRNEIQQALEHIAEFAELAPDDAIYSGLTDANEHFIDGAAPVYPQGDWAAGVFNDTAEFEFGTDWDRIPFPGTENMFGVVLDCVIPSAEADMDTLSSFLAYAGSTDGQERFSRKKGSLPARTDTSMQGFNEFSRSQKEQFDRSTEQPQTITHGLSVTPGQLVDLKSAIASFIDSWDERETTEEMVAIFDEK